MDGLKRFSFFNLRSLSYGATIIKNVLPFLEKDVKREGLMKVKKEKNSEVVDPRIAFFDRHAATWDQTGQDPSATLCRLDHIQSLLQLTGGQTLLEVGCGTGQITQWLADRVFPGRVVSLDFSKAMLDQARSKQIRAEFRQVDICADSPGTEQFDVILCFHSFPHFRDPTAALVNLAGALKPDGHLLILHFAGSRQINTFHDEVGGPVAGDHLPMPNEWDNLLFRSGLRKTFLVDQNDLFFLKATRLQR